jgi:glycosyltransferase involved in cell wall biosynthesis
MIPGTRGTTLVAPAPTVRKRPNPDVRGARAPSENPQHHPRSRNWAQFLIPQPQTADRFVLYQLAIPDLIVLLVACLLPSRVFPAWSLPQLAMPIYAVLVILFAFSEGLYENLGAPPAEEFPVLARAALFAMSLVLVAAWNDTQPLAALTWCARIYSLPNWRECRFCVTVSDFNRRHILMNFPSTPASKVVVQRLGVDRVPRTIAAVAKPEPRRFCLLSVGRLHAVKNYGFLIQACAALRSYGLDFLCRIVGEGPERPALEILIEELRLRDQVLLLGHVDRTDLSSYYRYADLIALTSLSEGLPVVLMEAMAHEKFVLAPAITGIPELVEHRRTGFLYKSGSLTDFVSTVRWILDHKVLLGAVERAAAKSIAANYDRQQNLRQFADQFLARIAQPESQYASSLLQQVQLPV